MLRFAAVARRGVSSSGAVAVPHPLPSPPSPPPSFLRHPTLVSCGDDGDEAVFSQPSDQAPYPLFFCLTL